MGRDTLSDLQWYIPIDYFSFLPYVKLSLVVSSVFHLIIPLTNVSLVGYPLVGSRLLILHRTVPPKRDLKNIPLFLFKLHPSKYHPQQNVSPPSESINRLILYK